MSSPAIDDQMEQSAAVFQLYDHELRPRCELGSVAFSEPRKNKTALRVFDCEVRPSEYVKSDNGVNANSDSVADPGEGRHRDSETVALHWSKLQIWKSGTFRCYALVERR